MINFNGGTVGLGTSISPLGVYAGYLLLHSGSPWVAVCFLILTSASIAIVLAMFVRYAINYHRNRKLFEYERL